MIKHLSHKEIDKARWDQCIEQCKNRLPYAFTWWLDVVSPGWEALMDGDYQTVMPLTYTKKLGIHYLYQPFFCQQLGIFSRQEINAAKTMHFLNAIPSKFRYIDIQMNRLNDPFGSEFRCRLRSNYLLDLSDPYDSIYLRYNRSCRRNILKASLNSLTFKAGPGTAAFTRFIEYNLDNKLKGKNKAIYTLLEKICSTILQQSNGEIVGVYDIKGELLASLCFMHHKQRCVLLVCASTENGRKINAMYFLIDQIIRQKAGTNTILDFSGSDIPGVSYFNYSFGAIKNSYPAITRNTLPWPINLFKK